MKVMTPGGHDTLEYDLDDPVQVEKIRAKFDEIINPAPEVRGANMLAFDTTVRPGEPVTDFPETATEILITPQIAGG